MRVVAGRARGRVLQAPSGTATRPTSDRVREAVFDILTSMDVIDGATVLDLFAGSGALGIEALSRGAASVVFVDHDRAATEAIRANLTVLGDDGRLGRVMQADALAWVRRLAPGARPGVVFADPPYSWTAWSELLASLAFRVDLVVAETGGALQAGPAWETVRSRRYGSTTVTILCPLAPTGRAEHASGSEDSGLSEETGLQPADDQSRGAT